MVCVFVILLRNTKRAHVFVCVAPRATALRLSTLVINRLLPLVAYLEKVTMQL